jgi:hypothetical protein
VLVLRALALCPLKGIDKIIEFLLDELSGEKQNVKKSNSERHKVYYRGEGGGFP